MAPPESAVAVTFLGCRLDPPLEHAMGALFLEGSAWSPWGPRGLVGSYRAFLAALRLAGSPRCGEPRPVEVTRGVVRWWLPSALHGRYNADGGWIAIDGYEPVEVLFGEVRAGLRRCEPATLVPSDDGPVVAALMEPRPFEVGDRLVAVDGVVLDGADGADRLARILADDTVSHTLELIRAGERIRTDISPTNAR